MSPSLRRRQLFGLLRSPDPAAQTALPSPRPPALPPLTAGPQAPPPPAAAPQVTAAPPTGPQPPAQPFSLARFYQGRGAMEGIPHFTIKTPGEPVATTSVGVQREPRRDG